MPLATFQSEAGLLLSHSFFLNYALSTCQALTSDHTA